MKIRELFSTYPSGIRSLGIRIIPALIQIFWASSSLVMGLVGAGRLGRASLCEN